jgi:hypothetical protein
MLKPYLITTAVLLLAIHAPARAATCKYEVNSVDKFTKVKTLQTKWASLDPWAVIIGTDSYLAARISAHLQAESRFLGLHLTRHESSSYRPRNYELEDVIVVAEGARLLVLMADDTIVELPVLHEVRANASYAAADSSATEFAIKTVAEINFALDETTTEALMKQEAKRIRVEAQDRNYDVIIDDGYGANFQWALGCIQ